MVIFKPIANICG